MDNTVTIQSLTPPKRMYKPIFQVIGLLILVWVHIYYMTIRETFINTPPYKSSPPSVMLIIGLFLSSVPTLVSAVIFLRQRDNHSVLGALLCLLSMPMHISILELLTPRVEFPEGYGEALIWCIICFAVAAITPTILYHTLNTDQTEGMHSPRKWAVPGIVTAITVAFWTFIKGSSYSPVFMNYISTNYTYEYIYAFVFSSEFFICLIFTVIVFLICYGLKSSPVESHPYRDVPNGKLRASSIIFIAAGLLILASARNIYMEYVVDYPNYGLLLNSIYYPSLTFIMHIVLSPYMLPLLAGATSLIILKRPNVICNLVPAIMFANAITKFSDSAAAIHAYTSTYSLYSADALSRFHDITADTMIDAGGIVIAGLTLLFMALSLIRKNNPMKSSAFLSIAAAAYTAYTALFHFMLIINAEYEISLWLWIYYIVVVLGFVLCSIFFFLNSGCAKAKKDLPAQKAIIAEADTLRAEELQIPEEKPETPEAVLPVKEESEAPAECLLSHFKESPSHPDMQVSDISPLSSEQTVDSDEITELETSVKNSDAPSLKQSAPSPVSDSPAEVCEYELRRYKAMLDERLITEKDYNAVKKRILGL